MSLKSDVPQSQRLAVAILIAVLLAAFIPTRVTHAQASPPASYTFEECDQVKAAELRDELNRITQAVFQEEQGGLKVSEIVDRNWAALSLDATVDAAIEEAAQKVMEETGYWERLISGWSPKKAEELTKEIAQHAFGSSKMRDAFKTLSQNISDDVVAEIRLITAMSATSALLCVQTFIGDTISPTMSSLLEQEIQSKLEEQDTSSDAEIDFLDIAKSKPHLLGGVGVVIVSQLAKSLGKKLAQSIAGKVIVRVLGKAVPIIVPVVGWILGVGLIVWDLWKAGEGSLPLIQETLQDEEVKQEVRKHVTQQVTEELRLELPQLARTIANDVYSQWQEFRQKFARVLDLAETNARFRGILDRTKVAEVKGLADLVSIIESEFRTQRLEELIENGNFERLFDLHDPALKMIRSGVEPEVVIEWADLAGGLLDEVVQFETHFIASPSDFRDRADLERVLALADAERIRKVMLLDKEARDSVLALPTTHVTQVLDTLSVEELTWLAKDYLAVLDEKRRNILVDRILRQPVIKADLNAGIVRGALLASTDFEGTLNYVSQRTGDGTWIGETVNMFAAIGPALSGELPLTLFWYYDGRVLLNVLYVLAGLIVLYIVWRRVFPGRRQDVNVNVVLPGNQGSIGSDSNVKRIGTGKDEEESN